MSTPVIYVLAGVNGSGKSSIGGAALTAQNTVYYNPDIAAQKLRQLHPSMSQIIANSHAWMLGKEMLEKAIAEKETYAFETTLGGNTIASLLLQAAAKGIKVKIWYVGLKSVDLNLARVKARVEQGGHHIPEADIRRRWDSSRRNLIRLLPSLDSLRLYDNSFEANLPKGNPPQPELLLHIAARRLKRPVANNAPEWAKPIIAGALTFPSDAAAGKKLSIP